MTQNQPKFNPYERKICKSQFVDDLNHQQFFWNYDDRRNTSKEDAKARMIDDIIFKPAAATNEFSSHHYEPDHYQEPKHLFTSNKVQSFCQNYPDITVFPTFMKRLRKNPYIECNSAGKSQESIEFNDYTRSNYNKYSDGQNESSHNCRCEFCNRQRCPSKLTSTTLRAGIFKDNIMTFSEKFTMTPNLLDTGCGSTHVAKAKVADVSVTASNIAVRETQIYSQCAPIPILKKPYDLKRKDTQVSVRYEPEKDFHDDIDVVKSKSIRSFFKSKKKHQCSRRNIDNEGICDIITNQSPKRTPRAVSPRNEKQKSKDPVISHRCPEHETYIPFSHRNDSKYHASCKNSRVDIQYDSEDIKHLVANPEVFRRTCKNKPAQYQRIPSIKLPRKVLASEQDIDSYIESRYMYKGN